MYEAVVKVNHRASAINGAALCRSTTLRSIAAMQVEVRELKSAILTNGDEVVYVATQLGITCLCTEVGIIATHDGKRLVYLHGGRLARARQRQAARLYHKGVASLSVSNSLSNVGIGG